jgi:hypothetical protein
MTIGLCTGETGEQQSQLASNAAFVRDPPPGILRVSDLAINPQSILRLVFASMKMLGF